MNENTEKIRSQVISLIESEYDSDAAFEREMDLAPKTVNNWRRGRSSSFMRMLPDIADCFGITISELMDIPINDSSELSEDEVALLTLYRQARSLPPKMRVALKTTIESTINMYILARENKSRAKNK